MRTPLIAFALCACSPDVTIGQPDAGDAGTATTDGGPTNVPDGGPMNVPDAGPMVVGRCPRVQLGRASDVTFFGDTTPLENLVISARLEWQDAPDDALELTVTEAGDYAIEVTSSNPALSASALEYRPSGPMVPFTRAHCPPTGAVVSIDGVYTHGDRIPLEANQTLVIFVSAPYWAAKQTGAYQLRVHRLP